MMFIMKNICRLIGNITRPIIVKCLLRYFPFIRNCLQKLVSFPLKYTERKAESCCFRHTVRGSLTSSWMNQKPNTPHHLCRAKEEHDLRIYADLFSST